MTEPDEAPARTVVVTIKRGIPPLLRVLELGAALRLDYVAIKCREHRGERHVFIDFQGPTARQLERFAKAVESLECVIAIVVLANVEPASVERQRQSQGIGGPAAGYFTSAGDMHQDSHGRRPT